MHTDNDVIARPPLWANGCHQSARFPVQKSKGVAGDTGSV